MNDDNAGGGRDFSRLIGIIEPTTVFVLLMVYWIFVRSLERVDVLTNPAPLAAPYIAFLEGLGSVRFAFAFILELLSPRVLRHFLPIIVAWWLARTVAVGFVWAFYELPDASTAAAFLSGLRERASAGGPSVRVKRDSLTQDKEIHPLLRVGGPGRLVIGESDVVVTERNGRFSRILGPGRAQLDKLEYVRTVLDLRQQERTLPAVSFITRDGLDVRADVSVTFRLRRTLNEDDDGDERRPSPGTPYPFNADAVRRAAYAETLLPDDSVATWEDIPLQRVIAVLRHAISSDRIDQLIYPELNQPNLHTMQPHNNLRRQARDQANAELVSRGIWILEVKLGRLETEMAVTQKRINYWQAYWDRQATIERADGEAHALREMTLARAEAEAVMLRAIVEGLNEAQLSGMENATREIVALRLIEALERMANLDQPEFYDVSGVLQRIQRMQNELRQTPGLAAPRTTKRDEEHGGE